jgi:hypothetical protein
MIALLSKELEQTMAWVKRKVLPHRVMVAQEVKSVPTKNKIKNSMLGNHCDYQMNYVL